MIEFLVIGLVVGGVVLGIVSYNKLVALRNQTQNAWKQIDVQLKRRYDLIPNLVEAVRGVMTFEKETLENVIKARNQASGALNEGDIAGTQAAEALLGGALGKLMVVVEDYPELKASQNVSELQEELASTENRIGFARQMYNDTATVYNTVQESFPTMFFTGIAKASPAVLWEITEGQERVTPRVNLDISK